MAFRFGVTSYTTNDGIPYIWSSGDEITSPTYVGIITHPNATTADYFGYSVAVGCGRIVVGAYQDDVNGISDSGSALIYDLNGNYVGIITHPTAAANDFFGESVAVGSGRIVVGAYSDDVNGTENSGSALIYDLNGNYVGIITHPTAAAGDLFGGSVAVGCGRIVVGAYGDNVNGISGAGSAHIYDLNGNYVGIITHPSAAVGDNFGYSVAVGSGRIVVGSQQDNINGLPYAGSALIYDLNGNYVGIITHPTAATNDYFGRSVAVGSGRIVVGAYSDDVNGISDSGSAHIYDLNGNYVGIITHPTAAANDSFGESVAVGCGRIVVGAYQDDVNGIPNSGSAHIYDLNGNYVGIITHPTAAANDNFGISVAVGSGRIVVGPYLDDVNGILNLGSALIWRTPNVYTIYDGIDLNYD